MVGSPGRRRSRRRSALKVPDAEVVEGMVLSSFRNQKGKKRVSFSRNLAEVRNFRNNLSGSDMMNHDSVLQEFMTNDQTGAAANRSGAANPIYPDDHTIAFCSEFDGNSINLADNNTFMFAKNLGSCSTPSREADSKSRRRVSRQLQPSGEGQPAAEETLCDMETTRGEGHHMTECHAMDVTKLRHTAKGANRSSVMSVTRVARQPKSYQSSALVEDSSDSCIMSVDGWEGKGAEESAAEIGRRDPTHHQSLSLMALESSMRPRPSPLKPHPSSLKPHPSPLKPHPSSQKSRPSASLKPHPSSSLQPHPSGSLKPHLSASPHAALDVLNEMEMSLSTSNPVADEHTELSRRGSSLTSRALVVSDEESSVSAEDLQDAERKIGELSQELVRLQRLQDLKSLIQKQKAKLKTLKKRKNEAHRKFEEVRGEMDKCSAEIKTSANSQRNRQDLLQKISVMQQCVPWSWCPDDNDINSHIFKYSVGTEAPIGQLQLEITLTSLQEMTVEHASAKLVNVTRTDSLHHHTLLQTRQLASDVCVGEGDNSHISSLLYKVADLVDKTNEFLVEAENIVFTTHGSFYHQPDEIKFRIQKGCDWACYYNVRGFGLKTYPKDRLSFTYEVDKGVVPTRMEELCEQLNRLSTGGRYFTRCFLLIHRVRNDEE